MEKMERLAQLIALKTLVSILAPAREMIPDLMHVEQDTYPSLLIASQGVDPRSHACTGDTYSLLHQIFLACPE